MKPAKSKSHLRRVEKAAQKIGGVNRLEILSEVSRIANSSLELEDRLNSIVEVIVKYTNADACSILLVDEEGKNLMLKATRGLNPASINKVILRMGEGISGWVCQNKKAASLKDAASDPRFIHFPVTEEERFKSVLVVPIMDRNCCIGVIYTQNIKETDYSEDDIKLLATIADQVSGIIKNAQLYEKATQRLRELSMLYEMSIAMQTTVNLDRLLRIILSCVTAGGAFGFNRAGLLLVNEKTDTIQGMMGLGPDSGEEAQQIWSRMPHITELSSWLISQGEAPAKKESMYDKFIKGIRLPIAVESGVIALTVMEKKPFNIKDAWNDRRVNHDIINKSGVKSFATVPIIAKENVLGVIVVDNIYTGKPIMDEDLQTLVRFAVHAGWAIENSKLFAKLKEANREIVSAQQQVVQSERLSALGELAAELAHEIKNPLVTIGGFARRLSEKYEPTSEEKSYASIIISEVEGLERLLKDILNYSRDIKPNFSENDINGIIEELLSFYEHTFWESGIEIKKYMSDAIRPLSIDPPQIKQVITNILYNAVESMTGKGGVMSIKTETLSGEEGVTISISDTGGGIPSDILENIFNPFFTTKKYGTGLGLSLSRKIVESHGGTIEINNRVGEGATFIINLPRRQRKSNEQRAMSNE